jgi:hypothetical protein
MCMVGAMIRDSPEEIPRKLHSFNVVTLTLRRRESRIRAVSTENYIVTAMISRIKEMTAAPP